MARYAAGDDDAQWREATRDWIAADPERIAIAAEFAQIVGLSPALLPASDAGTAWSRFRASVAPAGHRNTTVPVRRLAPAGFSQWRARGRVAAGLLLAIGIGWAIARAIIRPAAVRELATVAGGRASVTLDDGTRVVLGPATQIRVPVRFGPGARILELDGEAYFHVAHDAVHPFLVQTIRGLVRDVGTTFVVRAYRDDAADRVAVEEGRVTLAAGNTTPLPMGQGDVGTVVGTTVTVQHHADLRALTAWVQGSMAFQDTPLRDAIRELSRTFNVDITVADSALLGKTITGTFAHVNLDLALDEITQAVGAQYERVGAGIVIRRRATVRARHEWTTSTR